MRITHSDTNQWSTIGVQSSISELHPVPAKSSKDGRLQIVFRRRRRQIQIGISDRVEERANQLCAADGRAALRADIRGKTIQEDDLPVEQHDRHLRPGLLVYGWPSGFPLGGV